QSAREATLGADAAGRSGLEARQAEIERQPVGNSGRASGGRRPEDRHPQGRNGQGRATRTGWGMAGSERDRQNPAAAGSIARFGAGPPRGGLEPSDAGIAGGRRPALIAETLSTRPR